MRSVLRRVLPETVAEVWIDVLEERLRPELAEAAAGHCLRVAGLPRPILEQLAARLAIDSPSGSEVFFVDQHKGPEPWRVLVHKVVERRNAEEGAVLALFPPDVQLAAGDSVDVSTFREIPASALGGAVETAIVERIPEPLRSRTLDVVADLARRRWPLRLTDLLCYLSTVAGQETDAVEVAGGALYALGLVPDFDLFDRPEEFHHRLGQRNIPVVRRLADDNATPIERVLRLSLADDAYRSRLLALFREYDPRDVQGWGERVATDPEYRDMSLERWPLEGLARPAEYLRIDVDPLKLPKRPDDGLLLFDPGKTKLTVRWQTTPPPSDVPGLAAFRIEVVSSDRVVAWESPLIKNMGGKTPHRSRTLKDLSVVEPGVYFVRVIALGPAGEPIQTPTAREGIPVPADRSGDPLDPGRDGDTAQGKQTNETEDFLLVAAEAVEDLREFQPITNTVVSDYAEAELLARWEAIGTNASVESVRAKEIEWSTPAEARTETASATIRFDVQHQYTVRVSQRLRRLEQQILAAPEVAGLLTLNSLDHEARHDLLTLDLPLDLATERRIVLRAISDTVVEGGEPVVALANLCLLSREIEEYAAAYQRWLAEGDDRALLLDVVRVTLPEHGTAALLAPTHPLRLLWLLQQQQLARAWITEAASRKGARPRLIRILQRTFSAHGLPSTLVLGAEEGYLDAGPLLGSWGAFLPPEVHDSRAVQAALRARFGSGAAYQTEADVPPEAVADKFEQFLRQHPYTPVLVVNVVNPGDARLVVDALIELETRRLGIGLPDVRYEVRLFTDASLRYGVGEAFVEMADPERPISEVADRLVAPGQSLLFPKLSWSRHPLATLIYEPHRFPAHVTLLLDAFPVTVRVSKTDPGDRSSFVHGLIQDPPRRSVRYGQSYAWIRRPAPKPTPELPEAPGRSGLIASMLMSIGSLQAQMLAPNSDVTGITSVAALDLKAQDQTLIFCAHAASTWVLTLDRHLGVDYFDAERRRDRPGYLLDFTPEFLATGDRQLLLTTRVDEEVAQLMAPAAEKLGLDLEGHAPLMLLEALRSLSGRLALRFLSSPSQVQGALGMALSRLFLEAYGLLESSIVVPLDAHPELTGYDSDPSASSTRGDLLVVSSDPIRRHLDFLLVEAKNHAGPSTVGVQLRQRIEEQLRASESALREQFDPHLNDPDRIDRAVQSWRLGSVLSFYLDRAVRYGLVDAEVAKQLRTFFVDLEAGYSLSIRKVGLVFRLDAHGSKFDRENPEIPIWVVGRDHVDRIVSDALQTFVEREDADDQVSPRLPTEPAMRKDDTWSDVRVAFGGPALKTPMRVPTHGAAEDESQQSSVTEIVVASDDQRDRVNTASQGQALSTSDDVPPGDERRIGAAPARDQENLLEPTTDEPGQPPEFAVLLGESSPTPQFGLIGEVAAEPWRRVALDLNGCSTISVFGVQGSGKSYTVGSVIEIATKLIPGLNQLPSPLGAVVFHYHQTQDYPPEFVTMNEPNDVSDQVKALAGWGAQPAAIDDLLVLTTADKVARRQQEFPLAQVEPIAFSSAELTVADWRFLMGATGNDALYLKLVMEVMRKHRDVLTLETVRAGIGGAPLTDAQRALAETRLEFASRFIDDQRSLRSLLRSGRLVVVDLRDEFIERDQALELFVTMLNVFSGAGMTSERFNKLIVFDEAHKYMGGTLIGNVVEVIREMRHKGVSVVIASQDPVNVPPAVIELSSTVVLHRFNSPNWLKHIQKSLAALGDLTAPMLSSLAPGEAFIWANKATDATFTRRPVKVRLRPRATKHGGSTRLAVNE